MQTQYTEGRIISVLGLKGGVGKTTLAVNLAIGLAYAKPDSEVVLVDSNAILGDVGVMLNVRSEYSIIDLVYSVMSTAENDLADLKHMMARHESGLNMVLVPHYLQHEAESDILSYDNLFNMYEVLKDYFDYIVVDTSTNLDDQLAAAIQAADGQIVVSTSSILSLKDTRVLFTELENSNYRTDNLLLALNKYRSDDPIAPSHIHNFLKREIDYKIPFEPLAERATNRAMPLIAMSSKKVRAAVPLREMVKDVINRLPLRTVQTRPSQLGTQKLHFPYVHPERPQVNVLVVDDQQQTRELIAAVLEIGREYDQKPIKVVGQADNGLQAVEMAEELLPDVILMDINMPKMDGMAAAKRILNTYPSIAVIMVTVHDNSEYWRSAIQMGVADFIPKGSLGPQLAQSVEEVYQRYEPIRARFQPYNQ